VTFTIVDRSWVMKNDQLSQDDLFENDNYLFVTFTIVDRNWVMNFALVFEFAFAMFLIYTPGMEVALRFRPLKFVVFPED
jgi:hypothetical protein